MTGSAIAKVTCYTASPVEMCDRCGQGIKYVSLVSYRDGSSEKFGMDCIEKILSGDTSLKSLFRKNAKLLKKHILALAALSLPDDQIPRGSEYFGSGLYFIADAEGNDVAMNCWFFHPIYDVEKNKTGGKYVVTDPTARLAKCHAEIEAGKSRLVAEIARIEAFLAKVLRKAASSASVS